MRIGKRGLPARQRAPFTRSRCGEGACGLKALGKRVGGTVNMVVIQAAALNITVQSYAGAMEFGITACRRVLSQAEAHELIELLQVGLREIAALAPAAAAEVAEAPVAKTPVRAKPRPRPAVATARKPHARQRSARA